MFDEYEHFANVYDVFTGPFLAPYRKGLAAAVRRQHATRVLDVGCGTGVFLGILAWQGYSGFGIDRSPSMLARAAKNAPGVRFTLGDAVKMPYDDAFFDVATICFALHENKPQVQDAVLAEMVRVTRPGGLLAIADYLPANGLWHRLSKPFVHLVERAAGKRHYAGFTSFMERGATPGVVAANGLTVAAVEPRHMGVAAVVQVRP